MVSAAYAARIFFFSSRRRHTRFDCDWSSDVCSSDLSLRSRWLRGLAPALVSSHGGPDEPHQFACDRRHGDRRSLAVAEEMPVAAMQALLRPPRVAEDRKSVV